MIFAPTIHAGLPRSHRQQANYTAAAVMGIAGLAAPYGALSSPDRDGVRWRFRAGCFDVAARQPCKLWVCHSGKIELASTATGTLRLSSERDGLHIFASLPMQQNGFDARLAIGRGHITGFSVGFDDPVESTFTEGGILVREITYASLREISLATAPRFPQTYIKCAAYTQRDADEQRRLNRFFNNL